MARDNAPLRSKNGMDWTQYFTSSDANDHSNGSPDWRENKHQFLKIEDVWRGQILQNMLFDLVYIHITFGPTWVIISGTVCLNRSTPFYHRTWTFEGYGNNWNTTWLAPALGPTKCFIWPCTQIHPSIHFVGLFCVSHGNIDGGNITVGMKEEREEREEREGNNDWIVSGVLLPPFPAGRHRGRWQMQAISFVRGTMYSVEVSCLAYQIMCPF